MSEFSDRYRKLSRDQRMKVRKQMEAEALLMLPMHVKGNSTQAQCKAYAKKKVDIAFSIARRMA